jgi:hypothetical protein
MRTHSALALTTVLALLGFTRAEAASMRGCAVDDLALPKTSQEASSYAADVDGDGQPENRFGSFLAVLAGNLATDIDADTGAAVASGQIVNLIELLSRDATFTNDPAAQATWFVGEATPAPPLFNGTDTFRYDPSFTSLVLTGPLASHVFIAASSLTSIDPQFIEVQIRAGAQTITLPLLRPRLKFTTTASGLTLGQLNGSITKSDIDNIFVPGLATHFNAVVQADPQSDSAMTLLSVFDKSPTDGQISVAEVAAQPLITDLLAPDVQVLVNGGDADALSFGFGFTAVASVTILPRIFDDGFE